MQILCLYIYCLKEQEYYSWKEAKKIQHLHNKSYNAKFAAKLRGCLVWVAPRFSSRK